MEGPVLNKWPRVRRLLPADAGCARGRSRVPMAVAAGVVMLTLVGWTLWGEAMSDTSAWLLRVDVLAGVAGCAALPLARRRPVAVGLALAALTVLSPAVTPPATTVTLRVGYARRLPVAVGVAAAGVAAQLLRGGWRPMEGLSAGWWAVLIVAAYAALVGWGAVGQARGALIASLRERARRAEAEQQLRVEQARHLERTRIAREMHDVLAHRLSLLSTYAGAMEYRRDASTEELSEAAGVVRACAHEALEELREVIGVLREDGDGGRQDRPQPALADMATLVEEVRRAGMTVQLDEHVADVRQVPPATGRAAYRIVQEGLTNARKHARGRPVRIHLDGAAGSELTVEIRNPLPDAPPAPAVPGTGTGLVGLVERAELAGGRLEHGPADGEFRLRARLPWPR